MASLMLAARPLLQDITQILQLERIQELFAQMASILVRQSARRRAFTSAVGKLKLAFYVLILMLQIRDLFPVSMLDFIL